MTETVKNNNYFREMNPRQYERMIEILEDRKACATCQRDGTCKYRCDTCDHSVSLKDTIRTYEYCLCKLKNKYELAKKGGYFE